jgi:hypothetical protein
MEELELGVERVLSLVAEHDGRTAAPEEGVLEKHRPFVALKWRGRQVPA